MKRLILFLLISVIYIQGAFADTLYFIKSSDNKLYSKSDTTTDNETQVVQQSMSGFTLTTNGQSIVYYINNQIWLKNINWIVENWSNLLLSTGWNINNIASDWINIFYTNINQIGCIWFWFCLKKVVISTLADTNFLNLWGYGASNINLMEDFIYINKYLYWPGWHISEYTSTGVLNNTLIDILEPLSTKFGSGSNFLYQNTTSTGVLKSVNYNNTYQRDLTSYWVNDYSSSDNWENIIFIKNSDSKIYKKAFNTYDTATAITTYAVKKVNYLRNINDLICADQTLYYPIANLWYTGAYNTWSGSFLGDPLTTLSPYVEVLKAPNPFSDEYVFNFTGLFFTDDNFYFNLNDLFSGALILQSQWYIQSPIDNLNFIYPYIQITSVNNPIDYFIINGTGSFNWNWTLDFNGLDFNPYIGCVYVQNEKGEAIEKESAFDILGKCYQVWEFNSDNIHYIKWLIPSFDGGKTYTIRIPLYNYAFDTKYFISALGVWKITEDPYIKNVCTSIITGKIYIDWVETTQDAYNIYNNTGGIVNINSTSNVLSGALSFSFWVLPYVSIGADCSKMFNSGTFLYDNAGASLNLNYTTSYVIDQTRWSCTIASIDLCGFGYDTINKMLNVGISLQNTGINYIVEPFKDMLSYIWTPERSKNYCFAGKNILYNWRVQTYYDKDLNTIQLADNELTNLDYFLLSLLSITSIYLLYNFWK